MAHFGDEGDITINGHIGIKEIVRFAHSSCLSYQAMVVLDTI